MSEGGIFCCCVLHDKISLLSILRRNLYIQNGSSAYFYQMDMQMHQNLQAFPLSSFKEDTVNLLRGVHHINRRQSEKMSKHCLYNTDYQDNSTNVWKYNKRSISELVWTKRNSERNKESVKKQIQHYNSIFINGKSLITLKNGVFEVRHNLQNVYPPPVFFNLAFITPLFLRALSGDCRWLGWRGKKYMEISGGVVFSATLRNS